MYYYWITFYTDVSSPHVNVISTVIVVIYSRSLTGKKIEQSFYYHNLENIMVYCNIKINKIFLPNRYFQWLQSSINIAEGVNYLAYAFIYNRL